MSESKLLSFWKWFVTLHPAIDEHAGVSNTYGLFTKSGRCVLGVVVRLHPGEYEPEISVIVNNWTFGVWREFKTDESEDGHV